MTEREVKPVVVTSVITAGIIFLAMVVVFAIGVKTIINETKIMIEGYKISKEIRRAPNPLVYVKLNELEAQDAQDMVKTLMAMNPRMSTWMATQLAEAVLHNCERYGLEPWLVLEIIRHESHGNIFAKNSYTSNGKKHYVYGVMQVSDIHAETLRTAGIIKQFPQDLYTPEGGVAAGCYVLWQLMRAENGDTEAAMNRYSGGAKYVKALRRWM